MSVDPTAGAVLHMDVALWVANITQAKLFQICFIELIELII